jgi:uncharacterized protein YndB with AHSA1/START domain
MTTDHTKSSPRILGSVRAANGAATVHVEDRYDASIADLWSAITEPERLARWIAAVDGDLQPGGLFQARFTTGWEGPGRVDVCDPPRRLLLTLSPGRVDQTEIEAVLAADGERTRLVVEEGGLPIDGSASYGAAWQAQIEDLAAYLAGRPALDLKSRWDELVPIYRERHAEPGPG